MTTHQRIALAVALISFLAWADTAAAEPTKPYEIVDTGQARCYDDRNEIVTCPGFMYQPL